MTPDNGTGISLAQQAAQIIDVFPNPAADQVNVHIQREFLSGKIRFFNGNGQVMIERNLRENDFYQYFEMENLTPGIYLVQVSLDGEQFTQKLLVE
jgi:hypothetical protein